ncbi:hypothetical protein AGABI1DRAFT_115387 [Agaricus bisporus var. burnettii JB137-S8]|uniref:G domain-containing protein n=1 Tax=Agaricus bisporus var. burnettii (strain JB137-S8 / ATCC MYA-4627 / FGSC 10392) TaxID=597362 RepID=K5X2S7_AGABU|nr:uncharacterized protein AGABI1DRAFT_115387 [Agaricus bisporus var. burnettii JB137-S8]EKM77212.1 hypothetical protein AGABI1DRAFT_115387 [Agaricus bisporus var. burnettii JB137-S8]
MSSRNVILFGESGSGKSSIVNMLSNDGHLANVSSGAMGCTFESRPFTVDIHGVPMTLWDTAGLDEGDAGRVPKSDAIVQLYNLVRYLSAGVSLLMFVMRAPRIKSAVPQNWKLFHEVICQLKVPIVIAITGLEDLDDMDQWWRDNKGVFQKYGITPVGSACITASRGKKCGEGHMFDHEYEESRKKVRNLISASHLEVPWKVPAAEWYKTIINEIVETESSCFKSKEIRRQEYQTVFGEAYSKLTKVCEMSESDAQELAKRLRGT